VGYEKIYTGNDKKANETSNQFLGYRHGFISPPPA
jgi:hypothetical protein